MPQKTDIELLKELELNLGVDFHEVSSQEISQTSDTKVAEYCLNRNSDVIGIKINHCNLKEIPAEILDLDLQLLNLCHNLLEDITSVSIFENLRILYISNNKILNFPFEIIQIKNIDLRFNYIKELGEELFLGENLSLRTERLNFKNNNVSGKINIFGNPIIKPDLYILQKGNEAVSIFFNSLKKGEAKLYEGKIILVGEPDVGKTTISKILRDPDFKFVKGEQQTQGTEIKKWKIKKENAKTDYDFDLYIIDLGGQDYYKKTHRFFLNERALYIIVTNTRTNNNSKEIINWLYSINNVAPTAPKILVQNKIDENKKQISLEPVKRVFKNFELPLFLLTCNNSNENWKHNRGYLEELKKEIFNTVKKNNIGLNIIIPSTWKEIINKIRELNKDVINSDFFNEDICKGINKGETDLLKLFLNNLGIIFYKDVKHLRNKIFINPQWIADAAYQALNSEIVQKNNGVFSEKEAKKIWNDSKFESNIDYILDLITLKEFGVCFSDNNNYYYIPEHFNTKKPEIFWTEKTNHWIYEFTFEYLPYDFFPRLIVDGLYLFKENFWNNGIFIKDNNNEALVEKEETKIRIETSGETSRNLLITIIDKIKKILTRYYSDLIINEEKISCRCKLCKKSNPEMLNYEILKAEIISGEIEYKCRKRKPFKLKEVVFEDGNKLLIDRIKKNNIKTSAYYDSFIIIRNFCSTNGYSDLEIQVEEIENLFLDFIDTEDIYTPDFITKNTNYINDNIRKLFEFFIVFIENVNENEKEQNISSNTYNSIKDEINIIYKELFKITYYKQNYIYVLGNENIVIQNIKGSKISVNVNNPNAIENILKDTNIVLKNTHRAILEKYKSDSNINFSNIKTLISEHNELLGNEIMSRFNSLSDDHKDIKNEINNLYKYFDEFSQKVIQEIINSKYEIIDKIKENREYLLELKENQVSKEKIEKETSKILNEIDNSKEQYLEVANLIMQHINWAINENSILLEDKQKDIFEIIQTSAPKTKIELFIPFINFIGIKIKREFDISEYLKWARDEIDDLGREAYFGFPTLKQLIGNKFNNKK